MQALVVYESMFGNTREIALAVGDVLRSRMDVDVAEVGDATLTPKVDLLVMGAPTHAFGMSRPATRRDATQQAGGHVMSDRIGVREWIEQLSRPQPGVGAAVFDTRIGSPHVPGSAARGMHKRLHRLGFDLVAPPESFWVSGTQGPLMTDETARARLWAADLSGVVSGRHDPTRESDRPVGQREI
jgi:hypothetical protein